MTYTWIDDFKAVTYEENGVIYCTPTHLLTDSEKEFIYNQKTKEGYY